MSRGLTRQQQHFVDLLLASEEMNATDAYRQAYPKSSPKAAESSASNLLRIPKVAEAIAKGQEDRSERLQIKADQVLRQWWTIATADPNELIEYRRTCCRYCHGDGHRYQFTQGEWERRQAEWAQQSAKSDGEASPPPLDPHGGTGYDARREPHPDCTECHGEGVGAIFPKDTRHLSPAARLLYAGVKQTKEGLEIKMRDQDAALVNVAKHLGMFVDRLETRDLTLEAMLDELEPETAADGE